MHNKNCFLYSLFSLFVVGYAQTKTPPFITFTCNDQKKITNVNITDSFAAHVRVLKKNGDYCKQSGPNKDGILTCITEFNNQPDGPDKLKIVTLIYEDDIEDAIVGGINTKYYTLSCTEKAGSYTAVIDSMIVKPTIKPHPSTLNAEMQKKPKLKVLNHPAQIYVGDQLTLEMKVDPPYQLLPQNCKAYRTEQDNDPYMFWERCSIPDVSIISPKIWTETSGRSTLTIAMFAFRFIESETLIIKCKATVCPGLDKTTCVQPCKRRKRMANNLDEKTNSTDATVSLALNVIDRRHFQVNGSQGLSPVWYIYTVGFGLIYWMTWKKL